MPMYEMPALEEVICEAIVRRFFEPSVAGIDFQPNGMMGPNGIQGMNAVPRYAEAPMTAVVRDMYTTNAKDIAERVWARIDADDLADKIAAQVVEKLFATQAPDRWNSYVAEDEVNKRLADELTRRALAKLDAAGAE
jgi:hypothetical protein